MLRRFGRFCLSQLIFLGIGILWLLILVLIAHFLNVRAAQALLPGEAWVWTASAVLIVAWFFPVDYFHKRVMKRVWRGDPANASD